MKPTVRLVKIIGDIVATTSTNVLAGLQLVDPTITGINYLYGHYTDIRERLMQASKADPLAPRYPLIAMFEDFRVTQKIGLIGIGDLKIIILHMSRKDITRQQRESNVFLPILEPIYKEFMKQLKVSGKFMQYGPFRHNKIDRPHWGDPGMYGNEGYLFNEVLDGIEISDLQLQTYLANCVIA